MEITSLSNTLDVRKLDTEDVELVYDLMGRHDLFYQYHPPFVTRESILADMAALPPGKSPGDKHYIGFFQENSLVAVMDLILGYPEQETAFIGLFMMHTAYQNRGLGSRIIGDCMDGLRTSGYHKIRIGVDKGNPQSSHFWQKNGFQVMAADGPYLKMELVL